MLGQIKVTKYRKNEPKDGKISPVVAWVSIIEVSPWGPRFFNELQLMRKDQNFWIAPPSRQYKTEFDETKYAPYHGFMTRECNEKWQSAIMQAIDEYCKKSDYESNSSAKLQSSTSNQGSLQKQMDFVTEPPF